MPLWNPVDRHQTVRLADESLGHNEPTERTQRSAVIGR
jgi:hypothetical protein